MSHSVRVVAWMILFLAIAECGLRSLDQPTALGVASDRPVLICLGTSRTTRGLAPGEIEKALASSVAKGAPAPWVANASRNGITTVGLYLLYMREVRPLLRGRKGVVAIETRPSGFNDSYMTEEENRAFLGNELRALYSGGDIRLDDFDETASVRNRIAAFAEGALSRLRLSGGRTLLGRVKEQLIAGRNNPFPEGERGFVPIRGERRDDLDIERWRYHYEKVLLNGWRFGSVQTLALRFLIRQIESDGLTPVLYVMPVTDIQRSFWPDGVLNTVLARLAGIAADEGVDLVDLDRDNSLPKDAFHDTHHLSAESARAFSRVFAGEVFQTRIPR